MPRSLRNVVGFDRSEKQCQEPVAGQTYSYISNSQNIRFSSNQTQMSKQEARLPISLFFSSNSLTTTLDLNEAILRKMDFSGMLQMLSSHVGATSI